MRKLYSVLLRWCLIFSFSVLCASDFIYVVCRIQQSSTDIWLAICTAVKTACALENVSKEEVKGLGFAATCSLGM